MTQHTGVTAPDQRGDRPSSSVRPAFVQWRGVAKRRSKKTRNDPAAAQQHRSFLFDLSSLCCVSTESAKGRLGVFSCNQRQFQHTAEPPALPTADKRTYRSPYSRSINRYTAPRTTRIDPIDRLIRYLRFSEEPLHLVSISCIQRHHTALSKHSERSGARTVDLSAPRTTRIDIYCYISGIRRNTTCGE